MTPHTGCFVEPFEGRTLPRPLTAAALRAVILNAEAARANGAGVCHVCGAVLTPDVTVRRVQTRIGEKLTCSELCKGSLLSEPCLGCGADCEWPYRYVHVNQETKAIERACSMSCARQTFWRHLPERGVA